MVPIGLRSSRLVLGLVSGLLLRFATTPPAVADTGVARAAGASEAKGARGASGPWVENEQARVRLVAPDGTLAN